MVDGKFSPGKCIIASLDHDFLTLYDDIPDEVQMFKNSLKNFFGNLRVIYKDIQDLKRVSDTVFKKNGILMYGAYEEFYLFLELYNHDVTCKNLVKVEHLVSLFQIGMQIPGTLDRLKNFAKIFKIDLKNLVFPVSKFLEKKIGKDPLEYMQNFFTEQEKMGGLSRRKSYCTCGAKQKRKTDRSSC